MKKFTLITSIFLVLFLNNAIAKNGTVFKQGNMQEILTKKNISFAFEIDEKLL